MQTDSISKQHLSSLARVQLSRTSKVIERYMIVNFQWRLQPTSKSFRVPAIYKYCIWNKRTVQCEFRFKNIQITSEFSWVQVGQPKWLRFLMDIWVRMFAFRLYSSFESIIFNFSIFVALKIVFSWAGKWKKTINIISALTVIVTGLIMRSSTVKSRE